MFTCAAHDACFYRDALAYSEVGDAFTDCGDDARRFVAEDEGLAESKVAIAAVLEVMYWTGQERCACGGWGERGARRGQELSEKRLTV